MTEFERINAPRVQKIIAMLEVIDKSARSQRIGEAEIASLLAPIAQRLTDTEFGDTPVEDEPPMTPKNHQASPWENMRQCAEDAPLDDLTVAMAVYLNRIDEYLSQNT